MSLIRIDRVTKSFGPEPVLRDVSLHVERGDIFGIVGQSGAGKSTLLRTINLLETPDSGSVTVAGRDLTRLSKRDLRAARQNIGMIFQHYNLLQNLTVFDNVAFGLRLHGMLNPPRLRRRVLECLELVGLSARADDYPARLSGGQKQRVAIARALASQPEVLLCDEPTSALDAGTTRALLDTLRAVNADLGVTIVIVSHELPALGALCNRVTVLENGVVAETFAPADTTAPRITALGRELAFYGTEAGALFHPGVLHA
ncbi:ATP-binding cassette domain-containing protein [Telluria mixta]|uniref:ATP-binding cassette domain-containing protein n=1 Tax=Telluria mixta TaxID=34071 RepID=A0ABT2C463_9BURK|nr:ATP-binding cassette domain-containing protein [Telluria mixta]MCS0632180.1 ATP-binding cassette domain-containing protein [Telluria mixta]WEM95149.1 ATP-binding cassette domain-containing protein [Telluria mixta]